MRKGVALIVVILLMALPAASAVTTSTPIANKEITLEKTTTIMCNIGGKTISKELPTSVIEGIINMGKAHEKDFLTIYDKTKSPDDVAVAFRNVQPFFQALVDNGLTDRSVRELNDLYHTIREKIQEPKPRNVIPKDGPQPAGLWNGVPTPIWGNALCGIFEAGQCAGFVLGTHTLIPTIGVDLFLTYQFAGTSITLGAAGNTAATIGFDVIFGFIGILIVTPGIMLGGYFMTGLCGFMMGVGV